MRNIKENLFFAFVYNALGIPIAAGALVSGLRAHAEPDDRCGGDELQFSVGGRQCPPTARCQGLNSPPTLAYSWLTDRSAIWLENG